MSKTKSGHGRDFGEKYSHFGSDTLAHDLKAFGATTGKYFRWDSANDKVINTGATQWGSTANAGLTFGGGTSGSPMLTALADKNFGAMYTKTTATSGDSRGLYWRHYAGGTIASTGFADAIRAFMTVTGTGYSYATGVHATMQINVGATVTGSGAGLRATLAAESASRTLAGKLASLQVDSDIGASNTMPTVHGFMRFVDNGAVRVSNLAVIPAASNGTIFATHTVQAMTHSIRIVDESGTPYYIMCASAATNRG